MEVIYSVEKTAVINGQRSKASPTKTLVSNYSIKSSKQVNIARKEQIFFLNMIVNDNYNLVMIRADVTIETTMK